MINLISGVNQPWATAPAMRTAPTTAPTLPMGTPESSDGASISSAALQASEPVAEPAAGSGRSRFAGFAASLGLALCLAGPLSGCATMTGAASLQPHVTQGQTQKDPTVLNSVGSGTHKIVDGFKDMGKGIGGVFVEGWHQVREGWNSAGDNAPKQAPAQHHAPAKGKVHQHQAQ